MEISAITAILLKKLLCALLISCPHKTVSAVTLFPLTPYCHKTVPAVILYLLTPYCHKTVCCNTVPANTVLSQDCA